jgi:predicted permease
MLDALRQDLAYALRTLRRNAVFASLAVGGLAVGIGANTAIYSLIDAVLVRPLPVPRPNELVALGVTENVDGSGSGTPGAVMYSYPLYKDLRDANDVFTGLLATGTAGRLDVLIDDSSAARTAAPEPEHPRARFVSGNYFSVLGLPPAIGRTLGPGDDAPGSPLTATVSYAYWVSRFQRDSSIVGRRLLVNGVRVTITGVAAPAFDGEVVEASTDLWLPIVARDAVRPHQRLLDDRTAMWLLVIGRTKAGLTIEQARARLVPLVRQTILAHATPQQARRLAQHELEVPVSSAERGLSRVRVDFAAPLDTLMAGVVLLLCIVCVNVANLLLARGVGRQRELALRLAVGAGRARLVGQLLTESLTIAVLSAVAAVLVGWWASRALVVLAADRGPLSLAIDPNPRVLVFTVAIAVGSVVLFGLAPALRSSRVDVAATMRAGRESGKRGARARITPIAAQVALSLVLLSGAFAVVRGVRAALATNLGLDRDHLIVAKLDIQTRGLAGTPLATIVHALRDKVGAVPGVAAVSWSENGLFDHSQWSSTVDVAGTTARSADDSLASTDGVGAGFARGIGARLVAGRDLTAHDEGPNASVVLVNESFARFYFPHERAVGRTLRFGPGGAFQIVGVVADVRGQSLRAPDGHRARSVYYPYLHGDDTTRLDQPSELRLIVRTVGAPERIVGAVRTAIRSAQGAPPLEDIEPLPELVRASIHGERLVAQITSALGALALALAALGLFGVMSYSVARRTSEIGIRIALGAERGQVKRMILAESLRPIAVGVGIGLPLVVISMQFLRNRLADVSAVDPTSIAVSIAVLAICGVAAGLAPALRASRIDPIEALRDE